tara:strand:- start:544 stop:1020 length:477 start_codon:yes stop_codon:yes gene_type:complete
MDLLLDGVNVEVEKAKIISNDKLKAPVQLMSAFLMCVTENKMKDAIALSNKILEFEPENHMIKEYQINLKEYIKQGLDEQEDDESEDSDKENEEEEDLDEEKEDLEDDDTNDAKVEIESIKLQDDEKFEIANSRIAEEMRSEAKQSGPNFKKIGDWKY